MKVIKHAIEAKSWKHQLTCYNCKTELEIVMSDIKYSGERGDWHDSGWENYDIVCPECSTTNRIDDKIIHPLIKAKIQKSNKWFKI